MNRRTLIATATAFTALAALSTTGCGAASNTLNVAASSVPHAEILKHVADSGALKDVKIKVIQVSGDVDPNQLLASGDIDANYFQHQPYLADWNAQHKGADLTAIAKVHIEPLGLYSHKSTSIDAIGDGAAIAVPADTTNYGRALRLLAEAKLITLDAPAGETIQLSEKNITANPKHLTFVQIDRPQLPRTLDDPKITASVINTNYALEAGLKPAKDALKLETPDNNPYTNVLVTNPKNANDPRVKALGEALSSPETAAWITQKYAGSVIPANGAAK